jgi:anti-sigma-K factor RskA
MREEHIIHILETKPFASLSETDHSAIRAHTASCAGCARAYKVALVSSSLLQERVGETVEPSPFFHTRVMAAIREQQSEGRGFLRLWRAAGALVSSMAATVALFAVLSFAVSGEQPLTAEASAFTSYSAEEVILDAEETNEQVTDAQILTTLYPADEDAR